MVGETVTVKFKPGRVMEESVAMERGRQGAVMQEASKLKEGSS